MAPVTSFVVPRSAERAAPVTTFGEPQSSANR
jgi:hypothetical protein